MRKMYRYTLCGGISVLMCIGGIRISVSAENLVTTTITSGNLLEYIKAKQAYVGTSFDLTYQNISTIFQKTGMSLLKTIDYQSLVCLGVLPPQSLLSELQSDKVSTKTSFSKDFVTLENQLLGIEEKYRLQKEHNLDFLNGSAYEESKQQLKKEVDRLVAVHTGMIKSFETSYKLKIMKFVSDYAQYLGQNKELLQTINTKISKVHYVLNQEASLDSGVLAVYANLHIQDLMLKLPQLQASLQQVLLGNITPYIQTQIKKFKVLTNLSGGLEELKQTTLQQYSTDIDTYVAKMFSPWFDYLRYQKAKQYISSLRQVYYSGNVLQCAQILSSPASQESMITDISRAIVSVNSGVLLSKTSSLKAGSLSGLQTFLGATTSQKVTIFKKAVDTLVSKMSKSQQTKNQTNPTTGTIQTPSSVDFSLPIGFVFQKPFTDNQRHADIGLLQQFLTNQGYYTGEITSVYTKATKDAVYAFQLATGILKTGDRKELQGYFGPATRKKVNSLLK